MDWDGSGRDAVTVIVVLGICLSGLQRSRAGCAPASWEVADTPKPPAYAKHTIPKRSVEIQFGGSPFKVCALASARKASRKRGLVAHKAMKCGFPGCGV